jgi:hypothetical protein
LVELAGLEEREGLAMSRTTFSDGDKHRKIAPDRRAIGTRLATELTAFSGVAHRVVGCVELGRVRDGQSLVNDRYYDNLAVAAQLGLVRRGRFP